jgi:hypothetical protein
MKTNYKIILYLLPIVLLFTTCRKNTTKPADQHFYYYLTKEQLNKTPYFTNPAFDTLTYISNLNDTLVFAKTKTDTLWYISSVFDPGGTADKYYHYQQLRNSYATIKGEGKFEVLHGKQVFAYNLVLPDAIHISYLDFNFYIRDYFLGYNHSKVIDTVEFNNLIFLQATLASNNRQDTLSAQAYINKDFGAFHVLDHKKNRNWIISK